MASQVADSMENLAHVYLFLHPLLTSSHIPLHLHTKPQSGSKKKKKRKASPQPYSKMSSVSVLRKKKAEETMTHDMG